MSVTVVLSIMGGDIPFGNEYNSSERSHSAPPARTRHQSVHRMLGSSRAESSVPNAVQEHVEIQNPFRNPSRCNGDWSWPRAARERLDFRSSDHNADSTPS